MSSNSNRPNPPAGVRGYKPEDLRMESFGDVDGLRVAVLPVQKGAVNIFFKKRGESKPADKLDSRDFFSPDVQ